MPVLCSLCWWHFQHASSLGSTHGVYQAHTHQTATGSLVLLHFMYAWRLFMISIITVESFYFVGYTFCKLHEFSVVCEFYYHENSYRAWQLVKCEISYCKIKAYQSTYLYSIYGHVTMIDEDSVFHLGGGALTPSWYILAPPWVKLLYYCS